MALDLADQRPGFRAGHRELDDRARGLDAGERLLEGLGLHLERLGLAPVPVDHCGNLAAEARLARGAFPGRGARACREGNAWGHCESSDVRHQTSDVSRTASS